MKTKEHDTMTQGEFDEWYHAYTAALSDEDRELAEEHIKQSLANAAFNNTRWNNRAKRRNHSDRRLSKRGV